LEQKTIYIIRHGETDYNRQGVVQGSGIDADLNELGLAQAMAFFQAYKHVPFAKIYLSNLQRTHQTAEPFRKLGIPMEQYGGLNEISWGVMEGKVPNSTDNAYYRALMESWSAGYTDQPTDGGESPDDVMNRQKPVIDLILSRPDENSVLIVMHGRAMRILLSWLMHESLADMDRYEHRNVCLYKLRYDYETAQFTVELANDVAHLASLAVVC
jgi:broad specificity phosphatase PhoE